MTLRRALPGILALVVLGFAGARVQAQTPDALPRTSFEAAAVKPSKSETPLGETLENGRYTGNLTLLGYIESAYDLMPSQEQTASMLSGLPKWVSTDNFEIHAVAKGNPTKPQMRLMLQSLLADRFRLQVHVVTPQVAVLALILEKPGETGPKLRPHSEGTTCDVHLPSQDSRTYAVGVFPPVCEQITAADRPGGLILVAARNITIEKVASILTSVGRLGGTIVDQTGLSGRFDFTLEYTPESRRPPTQDAQPDLPITTLEEALHAQLGLKLKATKAALRSLVVDHVERPSEN